MKLIRSLRGYQYDARGNRIEKTKNGVVTSYSYNAANRLTTETTAGQTTYDHDRAGSLVRQDAPSELTGYEGRRSGVGLDLPPFRLLVGAAIVRHPGMLSASKGGRAPALRSGSHLCGDSQLCS